MKDEMMQVARAKASAKAAIKNKGGGQLDEIEMVLLKKYKDLLLKEKDMSI